MTRSLALSIAVALLCATLCICSGGPLVAVHTISADDATLALAADTGFGAVVQLLEWRQVEPAPGEYYWEYADWLVRACRYYRIDLALRLDHAPEWALLPDQSPPVDVDAYAAFVRQVSNRYHGLVTAYVIWNEPNLAEEWNGQAPDADGYRALLLAATEAVRQGDPAALVLAAGLAPTNQNDSQAVSDLEYLRALYPAGEAVTWDGQAVHPYGFAYAPDSAATDHQGLVFARLDTWQGILAEQGAGFLPLWVTECGWTVGPTDPEDAWQQVSEEQQAEYLVGALETAAHAYPRVAFLAAWNLAPALSADDPMSGFGLTDADGNPRPALAALGGLPRLRWSRLTGALARWLGHLVPKTQEVQVLAADVIVRLGDTGTAYPHWAKPYGGTAPSRSWEATFYLDDPGQGSWRLVLETMQVEERANFVYANGQMLGALPVTGRTPFASVWTTTSFEVPAEMLRPGANVLRLELSPRLRSQQGIRYESLQIRNVRLTRG